MIFLFLPFETPHQMSCARRVVRFTPDAAKAAKAPTATALHELNPMDQTWHKSMDTSGTWQKKKLLTFVLVNWSQWLQDKYRTLCQTLLVSSAAVVSTSLHTEVGCCSLPYSHTENMCERTILLTPLPSILIIKQTYLDLPVWVPNGSVTGCQFHIP